MRIVLGLLLVIVWCAHALADPCFVEGEREHMLALDLKTFDQTRDQGWRLIAERECYSDAAALIADYRTGAADQRVKEALRHHQMQMHAAAEERQEAVDLLDELIPELEAEKSYSNLAYQKATRAFLARDRAALQKARDDLVALPVPEKFEAAIERYARKYPDFPLPTWPVNLDVVDGFLNCFDKPYNEAYSYDCRVLAQGEIEAE